MGFFGKLLSPIYVAISAVLAFCYRLVPDYTVAIVLMTLVVMIVLVPLTVKSTRQMLAMQQIQPEIRALQKQYEGDRMAANEAMTALMRERGVSPAGGCLPMLLQLPVFIVLYEVIRGLTNKVHGVPQPKYIGHSSLLYQHLVADGGRMPSFGINLATAATDVHGFLRALPYYGIVALSMVLQYWQVAQMTRRYPKQPGTAGSMIRMQKLFPLVYAVIYLFFPAAINIYFLVSSAFRIGQQSIMYRYDPQVRRTLAAIQEQAAKADPLGADRQPGFLESIRSLMAPPPEGKGGAPAAGSRGVAGSRGPKTAGPSASSGSRAGGSARGTQGVSAAQNRSAAGRADPRPKEGRPGSGKTSRPSPTPTRSRPGSAAREASATVGTPAENGRSTAKSASKKAASGRPGSTSETGGRGPAGASAKSGLAKSRRGQ
jgi:YidC/Oxa1 family membrane protein insertase